MFIDFYGLPKVLQKVHGNSNFDQLENVVYRPTVHIKLGLCSLLFVILHNVKKLVGNQVNFSTYISQNDFEQK